MIYQKDQRTSVTLCYLKDLIQITLSLINKDFKKNMGIFLMRPKIEQRQEKEQSLQKLKYAWNLLRAMTQQVKNSYHQSKI